MLSAEGEFTLPGVPGVRLFPDDAAAQSFYALSETPRLAVAEDGAPEVSLTLYGRRVSGAFEPSGGVLTLTTVLTVSDEQHRQIIKGLTQRLVEAGVEQPQPQLLSPEWMEASTDVHLADGVDLTASASLSGANTTALNVKLSREQANATLAQWNKGLPDAFIRYRGRIRAATGSSSTAFSATSRTVRTPDAERTSGSMGFLAFSASGAGAVEVAVSGPLAPESGGLEPRLMTVEL